MSSANNPKIRVLFLNSFNEIQAIQARAARSKSYIITLTSVLFWRTTTSVLFSIKKYILQNNFRHAQVTLTTTRL